MNCPFTRVFVGHFEKSTDGNSDMKKLRDIGISPSLFKLDSHYSILVLSTLKREKAEEVLSFLIKKGFDAFIDDPKKE